MLSPGLSTSSDFSDACWTSFEPIQTSPDDLLTDQLPSSAANAAEAVTSDKAVARAREIPRTVRMMLFLCLKRASDVAEKLQH
jgi:hypothetical protein